MTRCLIAAAVAAALLAGCGSAPKQRESRIEPPPRAEREPRIAKAPQSSPSPVFKRGGGFYLDDGPGDSPPADLDSIPDAVPRLEPLKPGAMRPYAVMGQSYTPMTELQPYKARGSASWYGRRYHGKQTSSGETYDMYSMSAAHPVLPIPSYVRVTNVANGKSVVVRVNDRGPFIDNRLIDLSYTAAYKLGVLAGGSALVEVETIIPDGSAPRATMYAGGSDPILAIASAAPEIAPDTPPLSETQAQTVVTTTSVSTTTVTRSVGPASNPVYLQLGAFGSRENAESYLARAKLQVEWLSQLIHLFPRDGLYRVQAGPYASPGEARQAAERVAAALGMKPVVVTR